MKLTHIYAALILLGMAALLSCGSNSVRFSPEGEESKVVVPADTTLAEYPEGVDAAEVAIDSALDEYQYIDDVVQEQLDLSEEYYMMGYRATVDSNWLEAQFYFESALEILAGLDIDPEAPTLSAEIYTRLTNEIISDYKVALLYIATLPSEASPSAVIARYEELDQMTQSESVLEGPPEPKPDTVVFDIPIVWNEKVEKCITYFQTIGRKPFEISLARSGRYVPLMKKILKEENVPNDLVYLPLIESGFNPRAYSWAHAVGPWQFIASTGRIYGLHRSWWYDDRRDFEKSTRAAARHLRDLYEQTGDWYLALLGYNAGIGNVNKLVRRNGTRDYFKMRIRNSQMRNYVPLYLAATIIAKQPEKYGFEIEYEAPIQFDVVTVERCLTIADIADACGCSERQIRDLNPSLLRKYTPPDVKKFRLRIPPGKTAAFWAEYPNMESPKETSWVRHKVRRGQTVSGIARRYGVSQYAIIDANNLRRPYRININQTLVVPVPIGEARARTGGSQRYDSYELTGNSYVVRRGDTLWDLARAFKTSTRALRESNGLGRNSKIYVGQRLKIPGGGGTATASKSYSGETFAYKVKRGDTLWDLAKKYGTTVSTLRQVNGLSRYADLRIGQSIRIPGQLASRASSSRSGGSTTHRVRRGDTLWDLARKYGTSVSAIRRANNLSSRSKLAIGQKLNIPASTVVADYYVVRRGDTLSSIARNLGVSMRRLIAWNNIANPDRLSVGDRLRVNAQ